MIKIKCETKHFLSLEELTSFQGELKHLTEANFKKLRKQIERHGFCFPFFVWKNKSNNYILDGHQREKVLLKMKEEGIEIPDQFPIVYIEAKNQKDAAEKLLAINSQFGKMDAERLHSFIEKMEIDFEKLQDLQFSFIPFENPLNIENEWEGMPEFTMDSDEAFRQIIVYFKNQEDVEKFAEITDLKITEKTRYAWFPKKITPHRGICKEKEVFDDAE